MKSRLLPVCLLLSFSLSAKAIMYDQTQGLNRSVDMQTVASSVGVVTGLAAGAYITTHTIIGELEPLSSALIATGVLGTSVLCDAIIQNKKRYTLRSSAAGIVGGAVVSVTVLGTMAFPFVLAMVLEANTIK